MSHTKTGWGVLRHPLLFAMGSQGGVLLRLYAGDTPAPSLTDLHLPPAIGLI